MRVEMRALGRRVLEPLRQTDRTAFGVHMNDGSFLQPIIASWPSLSRHDESLSFTACGARWWDFFVTCFFALGLLLPFSNQANTAELEPTACKNSFGEEGQQLPISKMVFPAKTSANTS